ncbi:MAG: CvpA family protein [Edaphobacter sp.]|uniref:CvpA family protein n=1 Tax=Edaphobacter sp. TaxID=1934404 RepID=UPI00239F94B2|nr:CvpA family protein [Edaphobacter sp.]MDE1175356.1 CvpA family protein [Edaphobacter sp.]
MTPFDWLMVVVLAYSTVQAFMRGLVREIFSLCGLIAGVLLASWNYGRLVPFLGNLIHNPAFASAAAFLIIAIVVMILAAIAGRLVHATAHAIGLGFFNRLGGAAFGFLRGCLIGVAILMAISAFLPELGWVKNSRLAPYFLEGAHAVSFVVPQDLEQRILTGATLIKHNTADWIKLHP